jgi:hypothetical protein
VYAGVTAILTSSPFETKAVSEAISASGYALWAFGGSSTYANSAATTIYRVTRAL